MEENTPVVESEVTTSEPVETVASEVTGTEEVQGAVEASA